MQAELLLRGAAIRTLDQRQPLARSLAIGGALILACSNDGLEELVGPATRVLELREDRAVVPGFVDAHVHFGHFAMARREVDLDAAATLDAGLALLMTAARGLNGSAWLRGRGWDRNRWGRLPTRADLDAAVGDRPAAADAHWGDRCRHAYAWHDLLDAGATLAFGTDAPVERIEPLENLFVAITRLDPAGEPSGGWYAQQSLSLEDAVRAYTQGSAMAERAGARRGRLAPGMDADLVVLSLDPFVHPPEALRETRVEVTMVGGHVTFEGG